MPEAQDAVAALTQRSALDGATLASLTEGMTSVEAALAQWQGTYRPSIDTLAQRAAGAGSPLDRPTFARVDEPEALERYGRLAAQLVATAEETLRRESTLRRAEFASRSIFPTVIGALAGLFLGTLLPLALGTAFLRHTERSRYGGKADSHPLRTTLARAVLVAGIVGLASLVPAALAMGNGGASRAERDARAKLLLSLDTLQETVSEASKPAAAPTEPGSGAFPDAQTVESLVRLQSNLSAAKADIVQSAKLAGRLIAACSRLQDLDGRVARERQQLSTITGNSFAPSADAARIPQRIAELRTAIRGDELRTFPISLGAAAIVTAFLIWQAHRSWDDRKRRGSYGGW